MTGQPAGDRRTVEVKLISGADIATGDVIRAQDGHQVFAVLDPARRVGAWRPGTRYRWAHVYDVENTAEDPQGTAALAVLNPNWVLLRIADDTAEGEQGADEYIAVGATDLVQIQIASGPGA